MIVNYVIGSACILISIIIPTFYYWYIKKSVSLEAEIVEQIPFDNLLGQKHAWIISINDNGAIRRLFNTIYKSEKTKPKVGDKVFVSKLNIFGKIRYVSKFQFGAMTMLMISQFILLWVFAFIAFGVIR